MNDTPQFKKGDWLYDNEEYDYFLFCGDLGDGKIDVLHVGHDLVDNYSWGVTNKLGRFVVVNESEVPAEYLEAAKPYNLFFGK